MRILWIEQKEVLVLFDEHSQEIVMWDQVKKVISKKEYEKMLDDLDIKGGPFAILFHEYSSTGAVYVKFNSKYLPEYQLMFDKIAEALNLDFEKD